MGRKKQVWKRRWEGRCGRVDGKEAGVKELMGRKKQVWKSRWEGRSVCERVDGKEDVEE